MLPAVAVSRVGLARIERWSTDVLFREAAQVSASLIIDCARSTFDACAVQAHNPPELRASEHGRERSIRHLPDAVQYIGIRLPSGRWIEMNFGPTTPVPARSLLQPFRAG